MKAYSVVYPTSGLRGNEPSWNLYAPLWKRGHIVLHWSVCRPSNVCSISFDPFVKSCKNLYSEWPWRGDIAYWFSGHVIKAQGQTVHLHLKCCLLNILWPFTCTLVDFRKKIIPVALGVKRSRSNYWSSSHHWLFNCLLTILLDNYQTWYIGYH